MMTYTSEQLFFQRVLKVLVWIAERAYGQEISIIGDIKVNYIVKDDNPAVGFTVDTGEVTDAEGQVIAEPELTIECSSTDETVISVAANADGKSGTVSFGSPGQAAFQVAVKSKDGTVLGTGGDNFTVTTGDPAKISSVDVAFDGIVPAAG